MSYRYRPQSHPERDAITAALTSYRASASADPTVLSLDDSFFKADRLAFVDARETWRKRSAAARDASDVADAADADFDRDLRLFTASVRDDAGRVTPRVVSEMLGGMLPSVLSTRPYREEVERARGLLDRLSARSGMAYDIERAAALETSTAALEVAAAADEEAERALRSAGTTLATTRDAFDRSYMRLVNAARVLLEEASFLKIFPRFQRSKASADDEDAADAGGGGEAEATSEPLAPPV